MLMSCSFLLQMNSVFLFWRDEFSLQSTATTTTILLWKWAGDNGDINPIGFGVNYSGSNHESLFSYL